MTRRWLLLASSGVLAMGMVAGAEDSTAVLRNGSRVSVTEVSKSGVLSSSQATGARRLSLGSVRGVEGPLAGEFREHHELATNLWRAGARLDRGDAPGAEPLYESLWVQTQGVRGPTRAEVAAGLLACRVRRGAIAGAVEAWAAWLAESGSLDNADAERCRARLAVGDGMDSSAQWLVGVPPLYVDGPAVRAFASGELRPGESSGADVLTIYRLAAKRDTAANRVDPAVYENTKGWNNIAGEMVLAESNDRAVRERARKRLKERAGSDAPAWQVQWARLGMGRSLRLETEPSQRTDAVVELLWVATREGVPDHVLAQALTAAAETLADLDDRAGASRVVADLESRLPDHPMISSPRLARLRAALGMVSPQRPAGPPVSPPTKDSSDSTNTKEAPK
ncbi:MAG: hypothetical protein K2Y21_14430 [Phycisphaerales bacterium]|nr:hypothetical protein [Phycisphaerales bacterium]